MKFIRLFTFVLLSTFLAYSVSSQTGYIYVHQKVMHEGGSPTINYEYRDNPSSSNSTATYALSDYVIVNNDTELKFVNGDLDSGRVFAIANSDGKIYYRNPRTSIWKNTGKTGTMVAATSLAGSGTQPPFFYSSGTNIYFNDNGNESTILVSSVKAIAWTEHATGASSSTKGTLYIAAGSYIYRYKFNGTSWTQAGRISQSTSYIAAKEDLLYYQNGTNISYGQISSNATGSSSYGNPNNNIGGPGGTITGLAVNQSGEVYTTRNSYVYKWTGGTSWTDDLKSRGISNISGGPGQQVWGIVAINSAPKHIWSRGYNGTTTTWLDDERVKENTERQGVLIPVPVGTHSIKELVPSGWILAGINIFDPSNNSTADVSAKTATLNVSSGEIVHVEFVSAYRVAYSLNKDCGVYSFTQDFGTGSTAPSSGSSSNSVGAPEIAGLTTYHRFESGTAEDGYYKIVSDSRHLATWATSGTNTYDHTTGNGSGRMLCVNAGYSIEEFFRMMFTDAIPGVEYTFSAWAKNINDNNNIRPNIILKVVNAVDGTTVNSVSSGDMADAFWHNYTLTFAAPADSFYLVIVNNAIGGGGNDLAIDDISFTITPPSTPFSTSITYDACNPGAELKITYPIGSYAEYSLNNAAWQTLNSYPNLNPGDYELTIRWVGTTGCERKDTIPIGRGFCGYIYNDNTDNGIPDGSPANGIAINLYAGNGTLIATTTTNSSGQYSFDVFPGNFYVSIGTNGLYVIDATDGGNDDSTAIYGMNPTMNIATGSVSNVSFGLNILPLGISLVSFDAIVDEDNRAVNLAWVTETEINNDYFTVYRSADGKIWESVLTRDGAGNSSHLLTYQDMDPNPLNGVSYYRLMQTDFDGTSTFSNVVAVNFTRTSDNITVYPNPADNLLVISGKDLDPEQASLVNVVGQNIIHDIQVTQSNTDTLVLDVSTLSAGVYFVRCNNSEAIPVMIK